MDTLNDIGSVFEPISVMSLGEEVYRRLKQAIVDGDLAPGFRLVETALAQHMEVSRTPVREALQRLTLDGLVVQDGGRGLIVARVVLHDVEQAYVLREVLEGLAARLAVAHVRPGFLRKMADTVAVMERGADDAKAFDEAHSSFHDTLAEMSDNPYLVRALSELNQFRTRMVALDWIAKQRVMTAVPEHRRIYEAIVERDADRAEELARLHVRTTRDGLVRRLKGPQTGTPE